MTIYSGTRFFCVSVLLFFSETGRAQTPADTVLSHNKITTETSLFQRTDVLSITLSGNINELLSDRGETPQYHPVSVSYMKEDSSIILISAEAKTRGHFRKLKENIHIQITASLLVFLLSLSFSLSLSLSLSLSRSLCPAPYRRCLRS